MHATWSAAVQLESATTCAGAEVLGELALERLRLGAHAEPARAQHGGDGVEVRLGHADVEDRDLGVIHGDGARSPRRPPRRARRRRRPHRRRVPRPRHPTRPPVALLLGEELLARREHHVHVAPLLLGLRLDRRDLGDVVVEALQQRPAALRVGLLAAAEHDRHLDLVLVAKEALDVPLLRLVVVVGDLRAQLDLAHVHLLLVLARLPSPSAPARTCTSSSRAAGPRAASRRARPRRGRDRARAPSPGRPRWRSRRPARPSSSIRRTSLIRMRSLIRVGSRSGVRRSNRRGTGTRNALRRASRSG